MQINCFIFNWPGQTVKAQQTEKQLLQLNYQVTVINCDDQYQPQHWINIDSQAYFTQQWLAACERFDGDIMFHVQADATSTQWQEIFQEALQDYQKYQWGIYAPNVDYTWYDPSRADVANVKLSDSHLKLVNNPDCTVWFLHKDVINAFKSLQWDWSFNKFGWGVDLILCASSYLQKRPVIRNYKYTVAHPQGTGYNSQQAELEMIELYNKCSPELQQAIGILRNHREHLWNYLK